VLFPFTGVHDMDEIRIGQLVMRVLHTPGHRPESISLLVVNPADALGIAWAMAAIAGLTVVSGVIVLCRMYETLP